jgi:microcystin-dependent protein
MNKEDMIKIGIAAFVVIILIVIVVIVMRKKKDNYQYPSGKLYVQPSDAPGAIKKGNGGANIPISPLAALVADTNGNISTTAALPVGAIIMWGGSLSILPNGWGLCNGSVYGIGNIQSPDLTGRFVVGAGQGRSGGDFTTQYGVGDMGGEEFHQLTIPEMPSHSHNITSIQDGTNNDNPLGPDAKSWRGATILATTSTGGDPDNKDAKGNPLTLPHNNMPPYYALAYIIKYM